MKAHLDRKRLDRPNRGERRQQHRVARHCVRVALRQAKQEIRK